MQTHWRVISMAELQDYRVDKIGQGGDVQSSGVIKDCPDKAEAVRRFIHQQRSTPASRRCSYVAEVFEPPKPDKPDKPTEPPKPTKLGKS